jgi:steroid delta-isomerase-like uncharacterized protein
MPTRGAEGKELIMSEQNKAVSKRILEEVFSQGKLQLIDELVAANFTAYDPSFPGGKVTGREGLRQYVEMYRAAFPDLHFTIHDQFADGDKAATRYTATGTHKGALMGIAPTGKHATVTGITIEHYKDGKAVEVWANSDTLGMLQQLGVVPALAPVGTSA